MVAPVNRDLTGSSLMEWAWRWWAARRPDSRLTVDELRVVVGACATVLWGDQQVRALRGITQSAQDQHSEVVAAVREEWCRRVAADPHASKWLNAGLPARRVPQEVLVSVVRRLADDFGVGDEVAFGALMQAVVPPGEAVGVDTAERAAAREPLFVFQVLAKIEMLERVADTARDLRWDDAPAPVARQWTDDDLIAAVQRAGEDVNRPLSVSAYRRWNLAQRRAGRVAPSHRTLLSRFETWAEVCRAAGLPVPAPPVGATAPQWTLDQVKAAVREFLAVAGDAPTVRSYEAWARGRPDRPSVGTVRYRLGPWPVAMRMVANARAA